MPSDIALRVEGLGKKYTLGGPQEKYLTLRDAIVNSIKQPFLRLIQHKDNQSVNAFWALKNVSFEVHEGEIIGIIGRNGAGKSTLLKILSRITTPSEGTVEIHGRIGSLLEVGTGFHPELTGRENVFLSGSILGMKKREIEEKFDEIVKFSEIEKFLDTPVKRYSSGMYVRLAFAVAAHLDTEILLVDEVLAVGDAQFQKKCMGKMGYVAKQGRTVLFVSHNMAAIRQLCPSCILLVDGKLEMIAQTQNVIDRYLASTSTDNYKSTISIDEKKDFQLLKIQVIDDSGQENTNCNCDLPIIIEMIFKIKVKIPGVYGYMTINKSDGTLVMESDSFDNEPNSFDSLGPGIHCFHVMIPARTLGPGNYYLYLNFTSSYNIKSFNVDSPGNVYSFLVFDETSHRGNNRGGYFSTKLKWEKCNA